MKIYIDPSPLGWLYGFPKPLPDELGKDVWEGKKGAHQRLLLFLKEQGYPKEEGFTYRLLYTDEEKHA